MYDLRKRQEMRNVEVKDDSSLDDDYYDGQLED